VICHICKRLFDFIEDGWTWRWNRRKPGDTVKFQCPDHDNKPRPKHIQLNLLEDL
jgi:hypothetical protein